jgi:hypothetical protein
MDGQRPGRANEPERQPDDLGIEVGDLDQPTLRPSDEQPKVAPGKHGVMPWYWQSVAVPRPVVAAALAVLLVLVLLVALPGLGGELVAFVHPTPAPHLLATAPTPGPTATVTPFPMPTLVAPPVGPVPADCAQSPTSPSVGLPPGKGISAVGGGPVWVDGFVEGVPPATLAISPDTPSAYTAWGWPVEIVLVYKDPFTAVVRLTGSDVRTGAPLWWSFVGPFYTPPDPSVTFDPQQQQITSGGGGAVWWYGKLYLPGSGCYVLSASWPGRSWTVHFAAGR